MALEKELETFNNNLSILLKDEGKYVLISGDKVIDTFVSYEDALKAGYKEFGVDKPFLLKQIRSSEVVQFISRFIIPCSSSTVLNQ